MQSADIKLDLAYNILFRKNIYIKNSVKHCTKLSHTPILNQNINCHTKYQFGCEIKSMDVVFGTNHPCFPRGTWSRWTVASYIDGISLRPEKDHHPKRGYCLCRSKCPERANVAKRTTALKKVSSRKEITHPKRRFPQEDQTFRKSIKTISLTQSEGLFWSISSLQSFFSYTYF